MTVAPVVQAAEISVGGTCSLADAITSANSDTATGTCTAGSGDDTITISSDITLSADLPDISSNITINGGGNSVSGNDARRVFRITGGTVVINNLTVTNGMVSGSGADGVGGAVYVNGGTVTINNSTLTNTASAGGGALYLVNSPTVTVSNSVISNNTSSATGAFGAGIATSSSGATLIIEGSSITGNSRTGSNEAGGALSWQGNITVSISNSYIANNSGTSGAAMRIFGNHASSAATVTNTTITNNEEVGGNSNGSGIRIQGGAGGTYTFKHITLTNNIGQGGSVTTQFLSLSTNATIILANSLIDDAVSGNGDCFVSTTGSVTFTAAGNLVEDGSCSATTTGDPLLRALTGSGAGRHLPLGAGSPAIGAGDNNYCDDPSTDQIGAPRPATGCDIGAVEYYSPPSTAMPSKSSKSSQPDSPATAVFSTCETMNGGVQVNSQAGMPQCSEPASGGDVVSNQEIAAAGGYINAVDIWGWIAGDLEVCFNGAGALVFLDASTSPRTIYRIASYTGANGQTCAFIDRPGTVVLMEPGLISPMWPVAPWSSMPAGSSMSSSSSAARMLTGCMVKTQYILRFRGSPGGEVIPPLVVEENALLTALERTDRWFKVDYHGAQGWISANHVSPQGDCG